MLSPKARHILRLLSRGHEPTTDALRKELELSSNRQVRNLLTELREEGVPLQETYRDRKKHFYLEAADQERYLEPLALTERQMEALTVAAEAARATLAPTPFHQPLTEAFAALQQHWVEDVFSFEPGAEHAHWDFAQEQQQELAADTFRLLIHAIRERRAVQMDYYTASRAAWTRGRVVDPYLLAVRSGSWLLVAYCRQKRAVVDFSLAGMENVALYEPHGRTVRFERLSSFDAERHFAGRAHAMAGEEWTEVRLLVEPQAVPFFRRKSYHPSQDIIDERADGRIVVSYLVRGLRGIDAMVRSWGPLVTVLTPEALRDQLTAEFYELAARYLSGPPADAGPAEVSASET